MTRLLCAIVLLCQIASSQAVSPDTRQHLQSGLEAEKAQKFDVAIEEFRKVTELEPKLPAAFAKLGQALMMRGMYAEAIGPLKQATDLDSELLPAHRLLGYALLAQGYASEAIPHLQKVNDHGALGIAQLEIDQAGEAVTNLQAALAESPNDPDLLFYLSRATQLLSSQSMDRLVESAPLSARARQVLAQNYFSARQFADAEREYSQALASRPDAPGLHYELGQVYAATSQWEKAAEEFRAEMQRRPGSAAAVYQLGNALLQQGMAAEAVAELKRSNELRPDMTETLYALGKAASSAGDDGLAEQSWLKVTQLEKEGSLSSQAHFALATLYRKQKKVELANREFQQYRKLRSDTEKTAGPAQ